MTKKVRIEQKDNGYVVEFNTSVWPSSSKVFTKSEDMWIDIRNFFEPLGKRPENRELI